MPTTDRCSRDVSALSTRLRAMSNSGSRVAARIARCTTFSSPRPISSASPSGWPPPRRVARRAPRAARRPARVRRRLAALGNDLPRRRDRLASRLRRPRRGRSAEGRRARARRAPGPGRPPRAWRPDPCCLATSRARRHGACRRADPGDRALRPAPLAYPEARIVHIVRDGRDVACSLLDKPWLRPRPGADRRRGRPLRRACALLGRAGAPRRVRGGERCARAAWVWRSYVTRRPVRGRSSRGPLRGAGGDPESRRRARGSPRRPVEPLAAGLGRAHARRSALPDGSRRRRSSARSMDEAGELAPRGGSAYVKLGERLTHLREVRLQLGRAGEIGAGEVALQLPLAQPEQELRPVRSSSASCAARASSSAWSAVRSGSSLPGDEHRPEAPVRVRVEMIGRELGETAHEGGMRDARSERLAFEAVAGVEQPRCLGSGLATLPHAPARGRRGSRGEGRAGRRPGGAPPAARVSPRPSRAPRARARNPPGDPPSARSRGERDRRGSSPPSAAGRRSPRARRPDPGRAGA